MTAKRITLALLAAAILLVTPFAVPRESHLLVDMPSTHQAD